MAVATVHRVNWTSDDSKRHGLLTKKDKHKLQRKVDGDNLRQSRDDRMNNDTKKAIKKLERHADALALQQSRTELGCGISAGDLPAMVELSVRPPKSAGSFPKISQFYACAAALFISPANTITIIKTDDKGIASFYQSQWHKWITATASAGKPLDYVSKFKLLGLLALLLKPTPIRFAYIGDGLDNHMAPAHVLANQASRISRNDPWQHEQVIDWDSVMVCVERLQKPATTSIRLSLWTPGTRLNVFDISDASWRQIQHSTGQIFHDYGVQLKSKLDAAATLPRPEYAEAANKLYEEFNSFINATMGGHIGWVKPKSKPTKRHTRNYRMAQQQLDMVKVNIKKCKAFEFNHAKMDEVAAALMELEQIIGKTKMAQPASKATPFPHLKCIISRAVGWVDKQSNFCGNLMKGIRNWPTMT